MAKKSRKRRRRRTPKPAATPPPKDPPATRQTARGERPPAPWGSFPLVELVILVALVMLFAGFFVQGDRGVVLIGTGLALGSLAGLELSIREHFAGYRSHTILLSAAIAIGALAALFALAPGGLPPLARIAVAAALFALAFWFFQRAFRRRSGGLAFRVGSFRE
jgi:hypothetical protein